MQILSHFSISTFSTFWFAFDIHGFPEESTFIISFRQIECKPYLCHVINGNDYYWNNNDCMSLCIELRQSCCNTKNNASRKECQNEVIKLPGKSLILLRTFIDGYIHIMSHIQGRLSIGTDICFLVDIRKNVGSLNF